MIEYLKSDYLASSCWSPISYMKSWWNLIILQILSHLDLLPPKIGVLAYCQSVSHQWLY